MFKTTLYLTILLVSTAASAAQVTRSRILNLSLPVSATSLTWEDEIGYEKEISKKKLMGDLSRQIEFKCTDLEGMSFDDNKYALDMFVKTLNKNYFTVKVGEKRGDLEYFYEGVGGAKDNSVYYRVYKNKNNPPVAGLLLRYISILDYSRNAGKPSVVVNLCKL